MSWLTVPNAFSRFIKIPHAICPSPSAFWMISSKFKMAWFAGIVARCLDIWSWIRCKVLVGIPLGPQDLSMLRDDITLQISSLFVAFIMKESLFFVHKKPLRICLKLNFWLNSLSYWSEKVIESICDGDWVIDVFFVISGYGWCVIVFMFHWH